MRHRSTACVAVLISLASFAPSTSVAAESKQSVVIYVLGLSIDGTVAAGPLEANIDVDSSEIFDALDFGGMGSY
jgi:hypothetical protein